MLESITIFLRDFGYFNAGCLFGGMIMFALATLAFSGPLYWQQQDIKRYKRQRDDYEKRNKDLESINALLNKWKIQYQVELSSEEERGKLLEQTNEDLQGAINKLQAKNLQLYVEIDALKAHNLSKYEAS